MKKFFTSESVTEGHPDKVCDQIADAVLDAILKQDPAARAAIECCAAYDGLLIMGEVTANAVVDYEAVARETIRKIGYTFGVSQRISRSASTIPRKRNRARKRMKPQRSARAIRA